MQQNLGRMEAVALPLFRKGHVPIIGEWSALPLLRQAGSTHPGDEAYQEISYPWRTACCVDAMRYFALRELLREPTKTYELPRNKD